MSLNLEVRQLRYFIEVARQGSINMAATRLEIAQSALSRRMQLLEAAVGGELFLRRANGVTLTPLGEGLLSRAEPLLRSMDELGDYLQAQVNGPRSRLRFGITASTGFLIQDALLQRVRAADPRLALQISEGTTSHLIERVESGRLDLALVTNPLATRSRRIVPVWREMLALVLSAQEDAAGDLKRLARLPFVLTTRSDSVRETFERAFASFGLDFRVDLEMESLNSVKPLVASGRAFTILPYYAVAEEVRGGRLQAIPIPEAIISRALVLRASCQLSALERSFIRMLRDQVREMFVDDLWAEAEESGVDELCA